MKTVVQTILFFIPWLLSGILFGRNFEFYDLIQKPFFALPKSWFFPVWIILYLFIAISIQKVWSNTRKEDRTSYTKTLLIHYGFNQLFLFCFFTLKNLFLGFLDVVITMITALFLYYETKELKKEAARYLLPYVFFLLYALILSLTLYFINL